MPSNFVKRLLTKCGVQGASGCSIRALPDGRAHGFAVPLRVALGLRPVPQGRAPSRLPGFGAEPKAYAAAFFASVASARRAQEMRFQNQGFFNGLRGCFREEAAPSLSKNHFELWRTGTLRVKPESGGMCGRREILKAPPAPIPALCALSARSAGIG